MKHTITGIAKRKPVQLRRISAKKKQQILDEFGVWRNKCALCGKPALVWDGEKSICLDCWSKEIESDVKL